MNTVGQQVDPAATTAMWSAISAIVAVLATQVIKAVIVWIKGRQVSQGKRAEQSSRVSLSDREQLNTLINDMRLEYKQTIATMKVEHAQTVDDLKRELSDTDKRVADTNKQMAVMQGEDAQLRVDVATGKRDLLHALEVHDRDRAEWAAERQMLVGKVAALELQMSQMQKQTHRNPPAQKE